MSKRILMAIGLFILVATIGILVIQAATPDEDACYRLCRKYPTKALYDACYYGCMNSPH